MSITTLTSREFNRDTSRAKKATEVGPVVITVRGKPAHVLLKMEDYQRLVGDRRNIAELLALPGSESIELPIPDRREYPRQANLA